MTLFSARTHGSTQLAAGIQNKNGEYYTFARDNLSAGPLWRKRISNGGECPQCGSGSIAPSAYDGKYLYVGGGQVTMNGTSCQGSVQALNPANGNGVWQICLQGTVLGAVTAAPGIVVFTAFGGNGGNHVTVVNSSSGNVLFSYPASGSDFYGAATVVNSGLYVGDVNGNLYTFTP